LQYGWGVLIALPFWLYFVFGFDRSYMANMSMDTFEFIKKGIVPLTKGVIGNLQGFKPLYLLLPGILIALVIPHADRWKQAGFLICLIVLPILFILWTCITHHYWFIQRLFVWVMPWYAFLLGWAWDSVIIYVKKNYSR
jgi:hypothetical protein